MLRHSLQARRCQPKEIPARRPLRSFCFAFFSGAENKLKSENVSFFFLALAPPSFTAFVAGIFYSNPSSGTFLISAQESFQCSTSSSSYSCSGCPPCCRWFCFTQRVRRLQCLRTKNLQSTNAAAGLKPKKNAAGTCHCVCRISVPRQEPHLGPGR